MKAIVVDDEMLTAEHIVRLLGKHQVEVLNYYSNPLEALENMSNLKPDVIFLDIEMPEMSGLDMAEKICQGNYGCEIVFITAYNQYAIEAFSVNALDYLLKPVTEQGIHRAVERVKRRMAAQTIEVSVKKSNKIKISLFEKLSIYIGDEKESLRWTTAKCAEVFAFMLFQKGDKDISKWKLIDAIWPDKNLEKAEVNLRSTICRLNKTLRETALGISMISTGKGYQLEVNGVDLEVDAFELERLIIESININGENEGVYSKIILSYRGMILEEFSSQWCEALREKYHRYFINSARKLVDYYLSINEEPLKILNIMELMVKHEPYDEALRESALRLHYSLGGKQAAGQYYRDYKELLEKDLGVEPEASIKALYKTLAKA